jgi:hypothetical protein
MFKRMRIAASGRTTRDPLDSQIATRVFGYRWVEWNHAFLRGAPLDTPGRFLASPDHALAHLHVDAASGTEPAPDALSLVPPFTTSLDHAFEAASGGLRVAGPRLASTLCQATIAWLDRSHAAETT